MDSVLFLTLKSEGFYVFYVRILVLAFQFSKGSLSEFRRFIQNEEFKFAESFVNAICKVKQKYETYGDKFFLEVKI